MYLGNKGLKAGGAVLCFQSGWLLLGFAGTCRTRKAAWCRPTSPSLSAHSELNCC